MTAEVCARVDEGQRALVGLAQQLRAENLRRLHRPELCAVDRPRNEAILAHFLEAIAARRAAHRRVGKLGRGKDRVDQLLGHERSRCVVDHDELGIGRNRLQAVLDGVLPLSAAGYQADRPATPQRRDDLLHLHLAARPDDEHDLPRRLREEKPLQRVQQQGTSRQRRQELVEAHALAAPGGHHHGTEGFTHGLFLLIGIVIVRIK